MNQRQSLEQYLALLREVHALTLTENARLRGGSIPDAALLERKRQLSSRLDMVLEDLARATETQEAEKPQVRSLQTRLQEQMLQTILLDRENEALLLKLSFHRCAPQPAPAPVAAVRRAYGSA